MEIFLSVFKWSVITGGAALLLTLLKPALAKRYSPRWRYWAWLVIAVLSLLAPVRWETRLPEPAPVEIQVPDVKLQLPNSRIPVVPENSGPGVPSDGAGKTWRAQELLPGVWLGGIVLFALYQLLGDVYFRHKIRRWRRPPSDETVKIYGTVCQEMGVKNAPPLWVSGGAGSPLLLGLFRPRLILPGEAWDEQKLTFILRHELTHYRRHDLWYKLLLLSANAVHWFNPLLYLMVREAGVDLELTCDSAVVANTGSSVRRAYSETLLSAVHRGRGSAFSTHFYGGKEIMKERFRNILGKQGQKWGILLLVLTLLATLTAACAINLRQTERGAASRDEAEPNEVNEAGWYLDKKTNEVNEVSRYVDKKIAELAERGWTVTDRRDKFTLESEYSGELWPDEIQVWRLDYALKLENPEGYVPAGSEVLDGDGWLSGIDGLGDPYFIFSVDHGRKTNELLEIAYSNVQWELGYSWEEYVCCHTILGMNLAPELNGWPEVNTEFLTAQRDGHHAGMSDWRDVALTYLTVILEREPPDSGLSVLREFSREEGESRLIAAQYGEQTVCLMLVQSVYPVEAWGTVLSFWQVTGFAAGNG